jgi:hypothetical protein
MPQQTKVFEKIRLPAGLLNTSFRNVLHTKDKTFLCNQIQHFPHK